jgi:hypothetical protein
MIKHPWVKVHEKFDPGYLDLTDPRCLVRPSGSLKSPLAHHLNQPSFTTAQKYDGETADPTNGCIAMVMGNAYTSETFLFNQIPRRSHGSETIDRHKFPDDVQRCHLKFTADVVDSIHAKVEILYGAKVEVYVREHQSHFILPLWGEFEGVELLLMREEGYGNPDKNYEFRRVVVCGSHPQYLQKPHPNLEIDARQDIITKAARLMAGGNGRIPLVPNYYFEQKWKPSNPPPPEGVDPRKPRLPDFSTSNHKDEKTETDFSHGSSREEWDGYFFAKNPHSNNDLRRLIPPALAALQEDHPSDGWITPKNLPEPVQNWLRGQKQILFADISISSFQDITDAMRSILPIRTGTDSLKSLLEEVLRYQAAHLEEVQEEHQETWHSRFDGSIVEVVCRDCGCPLTADTNPRWLVQFPGEYIARFRRCKKCGGKNRHAKPKSPHIVAQFLSGTATSLAQKSRGQERDPWRKYQRERDVDDVQVQKEVECWCFKCKDKTVLSGGSTRFIDREPRWTIGDPPLYLERIKYCKACENSKASFVPTDASTLSTYTGRLRVFDKKYGSQTREQQQNLLDKRWARGFAGN